MVSGGKTSNEMKTSTTMKTSNRSGTVPAAPTPAGAADSQSSLVALGEFGRAHGLKGEVRLKSYTEDPVAIARYGELTDGQGRRYALTSVRPIGGATSDMLIARVAGILDRDAADALNRRQLLVAREKLPLMADEDEFLQADLIGLAVVDAAGEPLGRIVAVPNYGSGDLLEILPAAGGPTALLPFTKLFVPAIDIAGQRVTIAPPGDFFAPPGPERDDA